MWKTALKASQKVSISLSHDLFDERIGETASKGTGRYQQCLGALAALHSFSATSYFTDQAS